VDNIDFIVELMAGEAGPVKFVESSKGEILGVRTQ
jgi:hypothetical protein